jgi:hypothetical protein
VVEDQLELLTQPLFGGGVTLGLVAAIQLGTADLAEHVIRCLSRWGWITRKEIGEIAGEIERGAAFGERDRGLDRFWIVGKARGCFLGRAQEELCVR